jgi:hypothetical protein
VGFKKDDVILITESFGVGVAYIGKLATIIEVRGTISRNKEYQLFVKIVDDVSGFIYVNGVFPTPLMAALV